MNQAAEKLSIHMLYSFVAHIFNSVEYFAIASTVATGDVGLSWLSPTLM